MPANHIGGACVIRVQGWELIGNILGLASIDGTCLSVALGILM